MLKLVGVNLTARSTMAWSWASVRVVSALRA
jgi:hypothetical protein